MLVPTDFSLCGQLAARHACDVARAIGGTVILLHVLEGEGGDEETARAHLGQLSLLGRRPPACLVLPAASHGVASVILRVADELHAELIVIGAHGQRDPLYSGLGQVVRQVLQGAQMPVQVIPGALKIPQTFNRWRSLTRW